MQELIDQISNWIKEKVEETGKKWSSFRTLWRTGFDNYCFSMQESFRIKESSGAYNAMSFRAGDGRRCKNRY